MSSLTETTVSTGPRTVSIAVLVLRVLLALFFVLIAAKNLSGDAQIASDFQRFGFPDWFRVLVAVLQIAGAVLLFVPGATLIGCGVLAFVLLGAIVSHVRHDPLQSAVSPLVFLVLVSLVALASRRG